jgi:hypothetical protein
MKHIDTIDHIGSHIEKNFYALSHQNSRDKLCLCGSKKNNIKNLKNDTEGN